MLFISDNIEGFQQDGAQLFYSNPVINGSQAILADIQAYNLFSEFFAVSRFFQGNGPNRDRDGAKNKQRNGPIVTVTVATIQVRTVADIAHSNVVGTRLVVDGLHLLSMIGFRIVQHDTGSIPGRVIDGQAMLFSSCFQ
jgi:hypothetical protein